MKLFSLIILLFSSFGFAVADSPYFSEISTSSGAMVLEWEGPDLHWQNISINNQSYVLPVLGELALLQQPGAPQTPVDAATIQSNASLRFSVLDSVYEEVAAGRLCPSPTPVLDSTSEATVMYVENRDVYQRSEFTPASFVQHDAAVLRGRHFHRFQINPIKYNPVTGRLQLLRYLKISVQSGGVPHAAPRLQSDLDKKLARFPAISASASAAPGLGKASRGRIAPPRVKLSIVDDGIYSVSGAQLQDAGFNPTGGDPQNLLLENRGLEQACRILGGEDGSFDAGDQLLFYGERLAGENSFYHAYTDTNVYWLSWGQSSGKRITPATPLEAADFVYSFPTTVHFEEDNEYYQGDTNAEIQETEDVSGEGWVWDRSIDPGETFRVTFDLPGLVLAQDSIALKFRVRGETRDSQPDAHHIQVRVNGEAVYEHYFDDREDIRPAIKIAADVLKDSANVLQVESLRQGDRASRFYFDWFEVVYERRLRAEAGRLHIDSTGMAGPSVLWVSGFPSANVSVWNVADAESIEPQRISKAWAANLRVESAGIVDGNYADFYLENDKLFSGVRGINVVILNSQNGEATLKKNFDTFASAEQSDSLALLLNALPNGAVVMAGVRDDGANSLTTAAVQAFQALGSTEIANLQYRQSWAFIAEKGAATAPAEQRTASGEGAALASAVFSFEESDAGYSVQFAASAGADIILFDAAAVKSPLRIEYKESNPLDQISGADYVVLTHKRFLSNAGRLADYRSQHNGFTTAVVAVEDVFDAYSDGIFDPAAIQKFMKHAATFWLPGPSFLLLFGDATWDTKQHCPTTQLSNFVPSMGNPVSDALLVCLDGAGDYLPDVSVGRIPASTMENARAAVDKIIEYESTPSSAWKKNFLFISGGFDGNEQALFQKQSQSLGQDFVDAAPTFGKPIYINKGDEENQADERSLILDRINSGVLWANFIGHAASRTWELMFNNPDIEELSNQGRYPFISSMTCHTGRFAEPNQESFGERFLLIPEKGAIGFWGTSGWGYSYEDYLYLDQLFPTALADTVRYLGDIITLTKFALWQKYGLGAHYKNLILQYNLMGDPALTLALPTKPDMTIAVDDITVEPGIPSEADSSALVHVRVQNWGLAAEDSVDVRITMEHTASHTSQTVDLKLGPVARFDSTQFRWNVQGMAGIVDISAVVDPENHIAESDEDNNRQSVQVTVLTSHLELVSPPHNSIIPVARAVLKVQTPQQYFDENKRYIFQIDTTRNFSSPLAQLSPPVRAHPLVIKWQPSGLLPHQQYFWRVYDAEMQADSLFQAAFFTADSETFGWRQGAASAARKNVFENVNWDADGARLTNRHVPVLLQSAWTNSVGYAVIEVDNRAALQTGRGYNFAVIDQRSGELVETAHFDTYGDVAAVDQMVQFISDVPNGRMVLGAVSDEGFTHINEQVYPALESIGSAKIRQLQYRSMWAIIGRKGAQPGSVPEGLAPFQADGSVVLKDTLSVVNRHGGILSERIGPASAWQRARFDVDVTDSCNFVATVYGRPSANGDSVRLVSDVAYADIDLSTIDARRFPFLTLAGKLTTQNGVDSPLLRSWEVLFEPSPDIALSPQLFTQSADTVLVGQPVTLYLDAYNIGLSTAKNVELIFEQGKANGRTTFATIQVDTIGADRFAPIEQVWQSGAIPGLKKIFISADPAGSIAELSEVNNSITTMVYVHPDTLSPSIELSFDERTIFDGDLVSARPLIIARFTDNNPTPLTDTTRINLYLDGIRMSFSQPGLLSLQASDVPMVRGVLLFKPELTDGLHDLIVEIDDVSHNAATTSVSFYVENDLALKDVLNYPNPFDEDTEFRFSLSQPAEVQIKVFTVAGRLIRSIDAGSFAVGYNRIPWDGRDGAGDRLANGVYIYRIKAAAASESVVVVSKAIVMR